MPAQGGTDPKSGDAISTPCIVWEEIVDLTADEALAATAQGKDKSGVVVFLLDVLANGPAPKSTIEERAAARGFSVDQLKRAKQKRASLPSRKENWMAAGFGAFRNTPRGQDEK
jgi:hypothetical protein